MKAPLPATKALAAELFKIEQYAELVLSCSMKTLPIAMTSRSVASSPP